MVWPFRRKDNASKTKKKIEDFMEKKVELFLTLEAKKKIYLEKKAELERTGDPLKRKLIENDLDEIARDIESLAAQIEEVVRAINILKEELRRYGMKKVSVEIGNVLTKKEEDMLKEAKEIYELREKIMVKEKASERAHSIATKGSEMAKLALESIEPLTEEKKTVKKNIKEETEKEEQETTEELLYE